MENKLVNPQFQLPQWKEKNTIKRERLLKLLGGNLDKKVIWIKGKIGEGKTTLIAQWGRIWKRRREIIYYNVKKRDRDLFFVKLISAIQTKVEKFGKGWRNHIKGGEKFEEKFIEELEKNIKNETIIVIDDYHLVETNEIINSFLQKVIKGVPPHIHFIICSEFYPLFSCLELELKGEICYILPEELRFSFNEFKKISSLYKWNDDPSLSVAELYSRLLGWPGGCELIEVARKKLNLSLEQASEMNEIWEEFFEEEVWSKYSSRQKQFLMSISVLEEVEEDEVHYVLKGEDVSSMLKWVERECGFVEKVGNNYKLHPIFKEFLTKKVREEKTKEWITSLLIRGGEYFEGKKEEKEAVNYYLNAKKFDKAIQLIQKIGIKIIEKGEFALLSKWLDTIPEEILWKTPFLLLLKVNILINKGKLDEALELNSQVKEVFKKQKNEEGVKLTLLNMGEIYRCKGEFLESKKVLEKLLQLVEKEESLMKARVLNALGLLYYYDEEKFTSAIDMFSQAKEIAKKVGDKNLEAMFYLNLALCYVERGQFYKIKEFANTLLEREETLSVKVKNSIYINLGYVNLMDGSTLQAIELLKKALNITQQINNERALSWCYYLLGEAYVLEENYPLSREYFRKGLKYAQEKEVEHSIMLGVSNSYLCEGNLIEAKLWLERINVDTLKSLPAKVNFWIRQGEIELEFENFSQAEKLFKKAKEVSKKGENPLLLMKSCARLGEVCYKQGRKSESKQYIEKALQICDQYRYYFTLGKLGEVVSIISYLNIDTPITRKIIKISKPKYDLHIRVLGGSIIKNFHEETVTLKWKTYKMKSLFFYFIVNKEKVFLREHLIEKMWPEGRKVKNKEMLLRYSIYYIRKIIREITSKSQPFIEYKDGAYSLNPRFKIWIDVEEFEKKYNKVKTYWGKREEEYLITLCEEAISLYKGEFLPEVYEEWAVKERNRVREKYLYLLEKITEYYLKKKKWEEVIFYSQKMIEIDKVQEKPYYLSILAYLKKGERGRAVRLYNTLKTILKKEIKTLPSKKVEDLIKEILI